MECEKMNFSQPILNNQVVEDLFKSCLGEGGKIVEGVSLKARLDVSGREDEIGALLNQLPTDFVKSEGGGASFLAGCKNRNGEFWTDFHMIMDMLFILGIAAEQAEFVMPRSVWSALPDGMPYIAVMPKVSAETA
jgi:hypothetical protein